MRWVYQLVIFLIFGSNILNAEFKIALLIGNSNYKNIERLNSPKEDIPNLANKLRAIGFEVQEKFDLNRVEMYKSIDAFKRKLLQNPDAIALFYYSGHGSQAKGESYLIPVEVDTRDVSNIEYQAIKVEEIANKMANSKTKANILFLDACRNVPTASMGYATKGLAQVSNQPSGSIIIYSTSKNRVAIDNRIFNQVVYDSLDTNKPFISLANSISYTVNQKTKGEQVPEVVSLSFLPSLCLTGRCEDIIPSPPHPPKPYSPPTFQIGKLMYQNQIFTENDRENYNAQREGGRVWSWKNAKNYCDNLNYAQYTDWRLPNRTELRKLGSIELEKWENKKNQLDSYFNKMKTWAEKNEDKKNKNSKGESFFIKKEFVENMPHYAWFWTSSSHGKYNSWYVDFSEGYDGWYLQKEKGYALCVRGFE